VKLCLCLRSFVWRRSDKPGRIFKRLAKSIGAICFSVVVGCLALFVFVFVWIVMLFKQIKEISHDQ